MAQGRRPRPDHSPLRPLDEAVERSYRDLAPRPLKSQASVLSQLGEIRIDLARLSDELSNITKFFGDWHLARVYQALSTRFHLADWHKSIDEKLKTLEQPLDADSRADDCLPVHRGCHLADLQVVPAR